MTNRISLQNVDRNDLRRVRPRHNITSLSNAVQRKNTGSFIPLQHGGVTPACMKRTNVITRKKELKE